MAKYATNASGAIWWPNLKLMQMLPSGHRVTESISGSVVPLAMFRNISCNYPLSVGWKNKARREKVSLEYLCSTQLELDFHQLLHWLQRRDHPLFSILQILSQLHHTVPAKWYWSKRAIKCYQLHLSSRPKCIFNFPPNHNLGKPPCIKVFYKVYKWPLTPPTPLVL